MRAGKLRHKLTPLYPTDTTTDRGDAQITYTAGNPFYASLEPLQGRELWVAQQKRADATHKITMRYRSDITERVRLRWNGRTWEAGPPLSTEERLTDLVIIATEMRTPPK